METQQEIFNTLKKYYTGKENGDSAELVASQSVGNISKRDLRRICSAINSNPEINGLISTSGKIYVCNTEEECRKAIRTTYRMAFAYLKKARAMEKKLGLQGQTEFDDNGIKVKIIFENKENNNGK